MESTGSRDGSRCRDSPYWKHSTGILTTESTEQGWLCFFSSAETKLLGQSKGRHTAGIQHTLVQMVQATLRTTVPLVQGLCSPVQLDICTGHLTLYQHLLKELLSCCVLWTPKEITAWGIPQGLNSSLIKLVKCTQWYEWSKRDVSTGRVKSCKFNLPICLSNTLRGPIETYLIRSGKNVAWCYD